MGKRKKASLILPKLYIPGNKSNGRYYVYYSYIDSSDGSTVVKKIYTGFAKRRSHNEKLHHGQIIIDQLTEKLIAGWRPSRSQKSYTTEELTLEGAFRLANATTVFSNRKSTTDNYQYKYNVFLSWCKARDLEYLYELTSIEAEEFFMYLKNVRKLSNSTYNDYLVILKTVFHRLLDKGRIAKSPLEQIKRLKTQNRPAKYFNSEDLQTISEYLKVHDHALWMVCQFVYYLFLRPYSEVRNMKISWIDFEYRNITIPAVISKNNKTATLPIPDPLFKQLDYLQKYPRHYYVLGAKDLPGTKPRQRDYYRVRFNQVRSKLLLSKEYTVYSFKHTGAIMVTRNSKVSTKELQMMLRHHSLDMVDKYIRQMVPVESENLRSGFPEI